MSAQNRHKTWVEISKSALTRNASLFRRRLGPAKKLMAVLKADAYGHGLVEAARVLKTRADWFGVDNLDELIALRRAKLRTPVLVLGFTPSWRMAEAARLGASIVVGSAEQFKAAKAGAAKAGRALKLHLKVETGTTRQGVEIKALPELAKAIAASKALVFEGLSTHFANIEDTKAHAYAAVQLERYVQALKLLEAHGLAPRLRHTACTAAAMLYPETHFDMVRVGIGLYGIWPSEETKQAVVEAGLDLPIEPVLSWKTRIAQIKDVRRGTPVSYSLTEKMPRNGRVAVLGAGYWDGFDRGLSSIGEVLVRGKRCKVLGRVCMNMTMIDVTDVPEARAEDAVTLLGRDGNERVTAEEMAAKLGTIGYEVVARINPLAARIVRP